MNECVFCDRIERGEYDETAVADVVSFEPLNPVTAGHRLFVPREHLKFADYDPGAAGRVFAAAAEWGGGRLQCYNLIQSNGRAASQTVFHMHVHYVPRGHRDGLALPWTGQSRTPACERPHPSPVSPQSPDSRP